METLRLIKAEFRKIFTNDVAITVGAVLGVILGAVLLTMFIKTYALEKDEAGLSKLDYFFGAQSELKPVTNYSVQQAHLVCTIEIKRKLGSSLQTLTYDSRSSRYVTRKKLYKVFYDLTFDSGKGISEKSWAYCDVSAATGKLLEVRLKTDGLNLFGF